MENKMENKQYLMEIKGSGHPDTLCDTYSDIIVRKVQEYDNKIHINADSTTLKSGKFPKLVMSGNVSYAFDEKNWDYFTKAINIAKKEIVSKFKKKYKNAVINFDMDFSFNRNNLEFSTTEELSNDTSFLTAFYPYNEHEENILMISHFLESASEKPETFVGSDYKLMYVFDGNKRNLYISQCFVKNTKYLKENVNTDEALEQYKSGILEGYQVMLWNFVRQNNIPLDNIFVNLDNSTFGFFWNVYGSSVFNNDCGSVGRGNDFYGFSSPFRPANNEAGHGKSVYHPATSLYQECLKRAKDKWETNGSSPNQSVQVTSVSFVGRPLSETVFMYNTLNT